MIDFFEQYGNILAVVFLLVYYMPIIIAIKRRHKNIIGLGILNLFFGWTVIGWFGALIWSVNSGSAPTDSERKNHTTTGIEIERLVRLRNEGDITQEEFETEKNRLIN